MCMMGWGYVQNTQILIKAETIPWKHHFWSFLAITIAVCQIQKILILTPLQNEDDAMGICAKHSNFIRSRNDSFKTPFLVGSGNNNCSVSNANDFNTHTSSKWASLDGDMHKTQNVYSERKWFQWNTIFGRTGGLRLGSRPLRQKKLSSSNTYFSAIKCSMEF